jgi:hypothetical protein
MNLPRIAVPIAILVCLLPAGRLMAQTPTAVVNGTVVDSTGGSIPDAKVTVVNQETNVVSSRNTNPEGAFTIINLLPGNYILTVEKNGFKKAALPVFKLDVNQTFTHTDDRGGGWAIPQHFEHPAPVAARAEVYVLRTRASFARDLVAATDGRSVKWPYGQK